MFQDTSKYQELMRRISIDNNLLKIENEYSTMPVLDITCGKSGGLPFEYLMTDIYSGCLPVRNICYGNCTAAIHWIEQGYDFGKKVENNFNPASFERAIKDLPENQKWLRQGWASDFSYSEGAWAMLLNIAKILKKNNVHLLVITKLFYITNRSEILEELANLGVEIRVSLAASDQVFHLNKKLAFLEKYRSLGGVAIPYLMTAKYSEHKLTENQKTIIEWVIQGDYIAGEHPLRINSDNGFLETFDMVSGFRHQKFPDETWFGRILDSVPNFFLPAPTHLLPEYTLKYSSFSEAQKEITAIEAMIEGNLPTYEELQEGNIKYTTNMNKHATYHMNTPSP